MKLLDRFQHRFSKAGSSYLFDARIYSRPQGGLELMLHIIDQEPLIYEVEDVKKTHYNRHERIEVMHSLPKAKKWIKDSLKSFINNFNSDPRWVDEY